MKVLVISDLWAPFPGGAERLMLNVSRHLMRSGLDVEVVTGYEAFQRFDGPPVRYLDVPVHEHRDHGAVALHRAIRDTDPHVIVAHHFWAHSFEDVLADQPAPVVQFVLNGRRLDCAQHAVFISEWVRAQAGGGQVGDVVMTPPAFDDVRADGHERAIGFVKPLPHKGAHLVYDIARRMPARRFVVLRGEWQDLELIEALPNVEYMDPVDDIRDFWAQVDMVLVPSTSEDAGTVPQEAAVNGVPCLSTKVGGLAETNAAGVLLRPEVGRWTRAIRMLDDPSFRAEVVARQAAHLAAADHVGKLDRLAARVRELGSCV